MKSKPKFYPAIVGVLILSAGYLFVHLLWYSSTPMGADPVLDGKQNLLIAEKLLQGEHSEYPFHRAPLYPAILAGLQKVNVFGLSLPALARWLNGLAVLVTVWFAGNLAWLIWKRRYAVWIAGILVGLNPVVAFFAADPLDITLATTCLTVLTWLLYRGYKSHKFRWGFWLGGSIVIGLGMALRSHLMLIGVLWPVLAGLGAMRNRHTRRPNFIAAAFALGMVGPILSFLGIGIANKVVSGEFRMTPWGGAYLLWAGNGPMNNGRYYAQTVRVEYDGEYENPTIAESIYHYQQLTGQQPPYAVSDMNSFFIGLAVKEIAEDTGAWTNLMLRKLYSLIHNYEQYDNKTYSLQKSISPFLSKNPIGWGLIITLATMGGIMLSFVRKTSFFGILTLLVLYGVMVLSTFTANRYRIPMIPLMAVLAGGVPKLYFRKDQFARSDVIILSFSGVLMGIITFVPFFGIAAKDTYLADYALMANAAHRQGHDEDAIHWAQLALRIDSSRDDLREVAGLSRFNQWFGRPGAAPVVEEARKQLKALNVLNRNSPALAFARGVYLWKLGDHANACALWKYAVETYHHKTSAAAIVWNCDQDFEFLQTLPESLWRQTLAIKNRETGYSGDAGEEPLTEEVIQSAADAYEVAFEPFLKE